MLLVAVSNEIDRIEGYAAGQCMHQPYFDSAAEIFDRVVLDLSYNLFIDCL